MRGTHGLPAERYGRVVRLAPIVIVEDDPASLAGWTELLRAAGYDVLGATSFEGGRDALKSGPRLLIVDVRLGAHNGLHLIVRARSENPDLPSIVVTGFADEVIMREATRLGAVCLEKPIAPDRLLATVASAIEETCLHARGLGGHLARRQHGAHDAPIDASSPSDTAKPFDADGEHEDLTVADGDVLVVREPAGVSRPHDLITYSARSQFRVAVRGEYENELRFFENYDEAIAHGEQLAVERRARLFYLDTSALILVKDNRPNDG